MLHFIQNKLRRIYAAFTEKISSLLNASTIDDTLLNELKTVLLSADTGIETTNKIINELKKTYNAQTSQQLPLKEALTQQLHAILQKVEVKTTPKQATLIVGINGSGKTTIAAKLAYLYKKEGKKIMLVAADTFRAAASDQLAHWAQQLEIPCIQGKDGQDPASVVFQAAERFSNSSTDHLIIDTAGRLHNKAYLMKELSKIKKVLQTKLGVNYVDSILIIDGMLGQNSLAQAKLFQECIDINAIALSKMDSSAKGGIIFAIADELGIPIRYISYGETLDSMKPFNSQEYIENLLQK